MQLSVTSENRVDISKHYYDGEGGSRQKILCYPVDRTKRVFVASKKFIAYTLRSGIKYVHRREAVFKSYSLIRVF